MPSCHSACRDHFFWVKHFRNLNEQEAEGLPSLQKRRLEVICWAEKADFCGCCCGCPVKLHPDQVMGGRQVLEELQTSQFSADCRKKGHKTNSAEQPETAYLIRSERETLRFLFLDRRCWNAIRAYRRVLDPKPRQAEPALLLRRIFSSICGLCMCSFIKINRSLRAQ